MRLKTLAVAVGALALAAPALRRSRHDPDRVRLGRCGAGAEAPVRQVPEGDQGEGALPLHRQRRERRRRRCPVGTSQFAGQARPPLPSDAGTTYIKLYLDGLCIDVNPANNLSNISIPQVADIYHAVTTNWSEVPGSNLTTTIDPVGRDTNGGTYNFFLQAVLNNQAPSSNVNALTADGLVINAVKSDPNAIGYSGLAWQGAAFRSVNLNGVPCSAERQEAEVPAVAVHLPGAATDARTRRSAVRRLGPDEPDGGKVIPRPAACRRSTDRRRRRSRGGWR